MGRFHVGFFLLSKTRCNSNLKMCFEKGGGLGKTLRLRKISTDNKSNFFSVFREANVRQWHVQEGSILA